jgi:hypothetical protein
MMGRRFPGLVTSFHSCANNARKGIHPTKEHCSPSGGTRPPEAADPGDGHRPVTPLAAEAPGCVTVKAGAR